MIRIDVTEDHIEHGEIRDCEYCPIAVAINQRLQHPWRAEAGTSFLTFVSDSSTAYRLDLPESVRSFIRRFDDGMPVEPFTFEIDPQDAPLVRWIRPEDDDQPWLDELWSVG